MRFTEDSHLLFFHGFQNRRLGLGRGAVDLVGEHHMREDRPLFKLEFPAAVDFRQDLRADDVRRHQIRCELNALKRNPQCVAEGFD
jgi:hypothetical protein